jgi:diadenosine tetraphosphatase ApaH/serine/threonine PP2A family protein phosphatase
MSQIDVVWAFVEQSQGTRGTQGTHAAFSKRGNAKGYVNVFGPSHDPGNAETARVVVDHDGSVAFKDAAVANALGAQPRTEGVMAPSTGAAKWGLSPQTITARYVTADKLVAAIVAAMKAHASW